MALAKEEEMNDMNRKLNYKEYEYNNLNFKYDQVIKKLRETEDDLNKKNIEYKELEESQEQDNKYDKLKKEYTELKRKLEIESQLSNERLIALNNAFQQKNLLTEANNSLKTIIKQYTNNKK